MDDKAALDAGGVGIMKNVLKSGNVRVLTRNEKSNAMKRNSLGLLVNSSQNTCVNDLRVFSQVKIANACSWARMGTYNCPDVYEMELISNNEVFISPNEVSEAVETLRGIDLLGSIANAASNSSENENVIVLPTHLNFGNYNHSGGAPFKNFIFGKILLESEILGIYKNSCPLEAKIFLDLFTGRDKSDRFKDLESFINTYATNLFCAWKNIVNVSKLQNLLVADRIKRAKKMNVELELFIYHELKPFLFLMWNECSFVIEFRQTNGIAIKDIAFTFFAITEVVRNLTESWIVSYWGSGCQSIINSPDIVIHAVEEYCTCPLGIAKLYYIAGYLGGHRMHSFNSRNHDLRFKFWEAFQNYNLHVDLASATAAGLPVNYNVRGRSSDIGIFNESQPKMFYAKKTFFLFILGINRIFSEMMSTNFMIFYQTQNPPSVVHQKILNSATIRLLFFHCLCFQISAYDNKSSPSNFDSETEKLFCHVVDGFIKIAMKDKYNKVVDASRGSNVGAPIRTQLQVVSTTSQP